MWPVGYTLDSLNFLEKKKQKQTWMWIEMGFFINFKLKQFVFKQINILKFLAIEHNIRETAQNINMPNVIPSLCQVRGKLTAVHGMAFISLQCDF